MTLVGNGMFRERPRHTVKLSDFTVRDKRKELRLIPIHLVKPFSPVNAQVCN